VINEIDHLYDCDRRTLTAVSRKQFNASGTVIYSRQVEPAAQRAEATVAGSIADKILTLVCQVAPSRTAPTPPPSSTLNDDFVKAVLDWESCLTSKVELRAVLISDRIEMFGRPDDSLIAEAAREIVGECRSQQARVTREASRGIGANRGQQSPAQVKALIDRTVASVPTLLRRRF
jgi:hypothetical protein